MLSQIKNWFGQQWFIICDTIQFKLYVLKHRYKNEQLHKYDGVKITYLILLILLSTAFLLSMFTKEPEKDVAFEQMMTDLAIIDNTIDEIQMNLDEIIKFLEERDANK